MQMRPETCLPRRSKERDRFAAANAVAVMSGAIVSGCGARSNAGRFMEAQNLFSWLSSRAPTIFATKAPLAPLVQP